MIFFGEKVNCFCTSITFAKLVIPRFDFEIAESNAVNQPGRLKAFEVRFGFEFRYIKRERHLHLAFSN